MGLDHGILNVPLSKRGNIDAQLDKYKAEVKAKEAEARAVRRYSHQDEVKAAKQIVAGIDDATAQKLMTGHKLTRKQLAKRLNEIAHWTPKRILNTLGATPINFNQLGL